MKFDGKVHFFSSFFGGKVGGLAVSRLPSARRKAQPHGKSQ
jgi:hypothetical protein